MAGIFPAHLFALLINRVFIYLGSACVKLISSGPNWRGAEILTLVRIWVVKGIQEYHAYRLIHLSRSKYFRSSAGSVCLFP